MPIASILVPMYNRETLIQETIESALAQTISDIEVIVVDNASTDNSYGVVDSISKLDSRVKLYRNDVNIGAVNNWKKCVDYSTTPYSKILFSDDLIRPSFLEKTLPALFDPDCGISFVPGIVGFQPWVGGLHYRVFNGGCKINRDYFVRMGTYLDNFISPSPACATFRTSDLKKFIYSSLEGVDNYDFNRYGAGVDWLIFMLTALNYSYVSYFDEPLVFYRAHDDSISIKNENNMVTIGQDLAKKWLKSIIKGL